MGIFAHKSPRQAVQLAILNVIRPAENLRSEREWQAEAILGAFDSHCDGTCILKMQISMRADIADETNYLTAMTTACDRA
jgi:hypothetical protein